MMIRTFLCCLCLLTQLHAVDQSLAGTWGIKPADDLDAEAPPPGEWQHIPIPAVRWHPDHTTNGQLQQAPGVWLQREFQLDEQQEVSLCWEMIRWGFTAYLNGEAIGEHVLYGPGSIDLPQHLLAADTNTLWLKVRNYATIPRSADGDPLLPVGAADKGWGNKDGMVHGTIGLDFFTGLRMRAALVSGDPLAQSVQVIIRSDQDLPATASIDVIISDDTGTVQASGSGAANVPLTLSAPSIPAWSFDSPRLCTAEIVLRDGDGRICDRRVERFGARTLEVDGHLLLNGERKTLFGSNMVTEWMWMDEQRMHRLLTDEADAMNVGGFRTHTLPFPADIVRIADEAGKWLLVEMPATFNGSTTGLDHDEEMLWRAHAEALFCSWAEYLHNHPSVIAWVPINEPRMTDHFGMHHWMYQELVPKVQAAAPGRLPIVAIGTTEAVHDIHIYAGYWGAHEGMFRTTAEAHAATRPAGTILSNTEYIEGLNHSRAFRWSGVADRNLESKLRYAAIGAKQTETLRALGYTMILPYWLSYWTNARDSREPIFYALASALAPVGLAWQEQRRNVSVGESLSVELLVMNDSGETVTVPISCHLSGDNPAWLTENLQVDPFFEQTVQLEPFSRQRIMVPLQLPSVPQELTLVARSGATISQHPLRVLAAPETPTGSICVLGAPESVVAGLRRLGLKVDSHLSLVRMDIDHDVVVVWEDARLGAEVRMAAGQISTWVQQGGRLIVLAQRSWTEDSSWHSFPRFMDESPLTFTTEPDSVSTVWPVGTHQLWQGIPKQACDGWNGREGALAWDIMDAFWIPGKPAAITRANGWLAASSSALVIEAETGSEAWPTTVPDSPFRASDGSKLALKRIRNDYLDLNTEIEPEQGAYRQRYQFDISEAGTYQLQLHEHGRTACSPFRWRIDHGPWHEIGRDTPCIDLQPTLPNGAWFGWTDLGQVELSAGRHQLEIAISETNSSGRYHVALDAFLLSPGIDSQILAVGGNKEPAIVDVHLGDGTVRFTTLLFAGRLDPESPSYDPAAAQLFFNMCRFWHEERQPE